MSVSQTLCENSHENVCRGLLIKPARHLPACALQGQPLAQQGPPSELLSVAGQG